jgi:hypothetical protein
MAKSKPNTPASNSVVSDGDAEIRFNFGARSRIQSGIGINENSPYIDSFEKPMPAKTDIVLADDVGTAVLTPAGYTISMPLRRIDAATLDDKYQTALAYLDSIITDNPRNFNPQLIITGSNPSKTFNNFEDTLGEWGRNKFETEGEKKVLGSNKQVSLKYRGGPAVKL